MAQRAGTTDDAVSARSRATVRAWPPPPWESLAGGTILVALTVAAAPLTGTVPVAIASLVWMAAVAYLVVVLLVGRRGAWSAPTWVFVAGVGLATLRMSALGLFRVFGGRSALFWNVDWRYHATQAHGIARFGGIDDSLDYAGRPVEYHVGPGWIAGALQRTFGIPVDLVLLVVVPVLAVLVIALGAYRLLRVLGAARTPALLAVAVASGLATAPLSMATDVLRGRGVDVFLDAESWWLTPSLMLNSLLALAIGFVASWVIVDARSNLRAVCGAVGLSTLVAIKPQFFVGFVAALAIGALISRRREGVSWRSIGLVLAVLVVSAGAMSAITDQSTSFTGVTIDVLGESVTAFLRAQNLLLAAISALVVLLALRGVRRRQSPRLVGYSLGAVIGVVPLFVVLHSVAFLLDANEIARAQAIGLDLTRSSYQIDLQQALIATTFVVVLLVLVQGFGLLTEPARARRWVGVAAASVLIALTVPFTVAAVAAPTGRAGYEWTEEKGLDALYARVEADRGRWISSDLADSAQDFSRPLRATNLTSLGDAQFFLSNASYSGWNQDDVVRRTRHLQRFFSSEWSPWHDAFLRRHDIRSVLVRDRCPPAWEPEDFPGHLLATEGDWTLLRVGGRPESSTSGARAWPEPTGAPGYGRSACRSGALRF